MPHLMDAVSESAGPIMSAIIGLIIATVVLAALVSPFVDAVNDLVSPMQSDDTTTGNEGADSLLSSLAVVVALIGVVQLLILVFFALRSRIG